MFLPFMFLVHSNAINLRDPLGLAPMVNFAAGRGSFVTTGPSTYITPDNRSTRKNPSVGARFQVTWAPTPSAFWCGSRKLCDKIGFIQFYKETRHYKGTGVFYVYPDTESDWTHDTRGDVDAYPEYSDLPGATGDPTVVAKVTTGDNPSDSTTKSYWLGSYSLQSVSVRFLTFVVCLQGEESITGKNPKVYGVIDWGYSALPTASGTYLENYTLGAQSWTDTTIPPAVGFANGMGGLSPAYTGIPNASQMKLMDDLVLHLNSDEF